MLYDLNCEVLGFQDTEKFFISYPKDLHSLFNVDTIQSSAFSLHYSWVYMSLLQLIGSKESVVADAILVLARTSKVQLVPQRQKYIHFYFSSDSLSNGFQNTTSV